MLQHAAANKYIFNSSFTGRALQTVELRFYVLPDTKKVILDTFFPANLLA